MENHLVLVYYFNFLIVLMIIISFYEISPYYKTKKFQLKFMHAKTQLIRNLTDFCDVKDEDILNDQGISIKDLQLLYNIHVNKSENTSTEVCFQDSRTLFVKLIDIIFLTNYNEYIKEEKTYVNSILNTLEIINYEFLNFFQSSINDAKNNIDKIFEGLDIYDKYELNKFLNVTFTLRIRENSTFVLINGEDLQKYLEQSKLNGNLPLKLKNSFRYFSELNEKNNTYLSEITEKVLTSNTYLSKYFGINESRFPLKYFYGKNISVDTQLQVIRMKNLLKEFVTSMFCDRERKGISTTSYLELNVGYLKSLIDDERKALDTVIEEKTHALFIKLNKILCGDIKCMIAFIAYVLEIVRTENKFKLDDIEKNYGEELYKNKILHDIYTLLLHERDYIKKSLLEFKIYIEAIFGFDVNSWGIRSLVKKLYGLIDKKEIMKLFNVIVYSLLCKKQIDEYENFIKLLKNESGGSIFHRRAFINFFKKSEDFVFIPENKSINVMFKFMEIYDQNNFLYKLNFIFEDISNILKKFKNSTDRFKVFNKLIYLLNEELIMSKDLYFSSNQKVILRKNEILLFLCAIKNFQENNIICGT
ncbi:fam-f protein [Plasmodium gallinaceum]|uniref:Fam-f protein n=1 Tax=Plasmodium gallinaceum TaxID=5849 RepID=A0A1J1GSR2_PLAGA|nr:fam-f protein [Plasmodium gallinaceum]CRG95531.1 fam-f protein [Plasmodium gallinaceum]